jgi:adenylate cyclase
MENLPFLLLLVACPLGMVAMVAATWVGVRLMAGRAGQGDSQAWSIRDPTGGGQPESAERAGDHRDEVATLVEGEPGRPQTFQFADLAGFTALTEAHGDDHAADLARDFRDAVRELLPAHDSQEVKSLGDGLMIRSSDPSAAVRLGLRIVREVGAQHGFPLVRVGIHTGPATERSGDWFGTSVNIAARVSNIAAGGEVLLTEATAEAAHPLGAIDLRELAEQRLKNISEPVKLYSALPQGEEPSERLPIDPVCRMAVEPPRKAGLIVHEGVEYIFCSLGCAEAFARAPERHLSPRDPSNWTPDENRPAPTERWLSIPSTQEPCPSEPRAAMVLAGHGTAELATAQERS